MKKPHSSLIIRAALRSLFSAALLCSAPTSAAPDSFSGILSEQTTSLTGKTPGTPHEGPVLIQFWASWCTRCSTMFDDLDQFAGDHPELPVIALSIDEDESAARAYLAKKKAVKDNTKLGFLHDKDGRLGSLFGVNAVPTVLLVSSDGTVLSRAGGHLKKSDLLKISRKLNHQNK